MAASGGMVGREEELSAIVGFLDRSESLPATLVLTGEAGIGKTTLWRRSLDLASARSYRVLSCSPSESEAQLSFTGLGDLLEDVLDEALEPLPGPQRRALAAALLLEEAAGPPPDQRAIALAFLGALRALAESNPVALAVDDVQWLDSSSVFVIAFALRRLRAERVAALFGLRTDPASEPLELERALPAERLQSVVVGPLSLGAVNHLLAERLGLALPRPKLRRLHELSGGNPFFALELGRAAQRGEIKLGPGESLPATLAALVHERLAVLPATTRSILLAISALSQPTLSLLARAGSDDPEQRLAPALDAHVIELDADRVRFSHPLLSSGVYASAGLAERRALHRRLADLVADPEERVRHLALGAEGPDPDVSAALEDAARRARARGALPAAAELSEEARRLTPPDREADGHRRTIQTAAYAFSAGESRRAKELLLSALDAAQAGPGRAHALYWLGILEEYEGDRHVAVELFRDGLAQVGDDLALRAQLEEWLADALYLMRRDLATAAEHARAAVALAERIGDTSLHVTALAEQGMIETVLGRPRWRAAFERAAELEPVAGPLDLLSSPPFPLALSLMWVDELDEARTILQSLRELADERAEESSLPWILAVMGFVEFLAGRWEDAHRYAEEAEEIAGQTAQEPQRIDALGVRALVRAARGDVEGAREDAEETLTIADERGVMIATIIASSALGLLELSLGHPEEAHRRLAPLAELLEEGGVYEPGSVRFVPDAIEALIALGRLEEAEALLDRHEERARRLDRASALAAAARCRGLLAATRGELDAALEWLERALAEHERVPGPFEQARTLLAQGSILRRRQRKRLAREALERALAGFERLGADVYAERARSELARIGGRAAAAADELSETERRIADLVAQGRSNKEVAAALSLSPKTVEWNLSKVYAKLGVRSRTELASRRR